MKRITVRETINIEYSAQQISQALELPENAIMVVQVPSGGDYSGCEIDLEILKVRWVEDRTLSESEIETQRVRYQKDINGRHISPNGAQPCSEIHDAEKWMLDQGMVIPNRQIHPKLFQGMMDDYSRNKFIAITSSQKEEDIPF